MQSRYWLVVFILLLSLIEVKAQLKLGAKISYTHSFVGNTEQLYDNDFNYVIYRLELQKQQIFPSIGAVAYYRFNTRFNNQQLYAFAQLETIYNYRRTHFLLENYLSGAKPETEIFKATSFLRFPVLGGLELKRWKFGIGPVFSFLVNDKLALQSYPNFDENYNTFEPAASILLGYNYDNLVFDISYEYHFNGVSEFIFYKNQQQGFKEQPHYLSFNLSFMFKYKKKHWRN